MFQSIEPRFFNKVRQTLPRKNTDINKKFNKEEDFFACFETFIYDTIIRLLKIMETEKNKAGKQYRRSKEVKATPKFTDIMEHFYVMI